MALYLGAGVSIGSGLPTWNQLVLAIYFSAVSDDWKARWRPYPNYLYAIAEWQLQREHEPLEITARKIRQYYPNDYDFLKDLRATLYAGFLEEETQFWSHPSAVQIRRQNPTLDGVAGLCCATRPNGRGVRAVITYNYDNLLGIVSQDSPCPFVAVWKSAELLAHNQRPIIHVHGYIPATGQGSPPEEIILPSSNTIALPIALIRGAICRKYNASLVSLG